VVAGATEETIPTWILQYFDDVAARLAGRGGTSSPKRITANLELFTRGGGASAGPRAAAATRDRAIKANVRLHQTHGGLTRDDAIDRVAGETRLTAERVERILYEKPSTKRRRTRKMRQRRK
jgi:hypothetical protein